MHTQTYLGDNFISITLYPAVVVPTSLVYCYARLVLGIVHSTSTCFGGMHDV